MIYRSHDDDKSVQMQTIWPQKAHQSICACSLLPRYNNSSASHTAFLTCHGLNIHPQHFKWFMQESHAINNSWSFHTQHPCSMEEILPGQFIFATCYIWQAHEREFTISVSWTRVNDWFTALLPLATLLHTTSHTLLISTTDWTWLSQLLSMSISHFYSGMCLSLHMSNCYVVLKQECCLQCMH